MKFCKCQNLNYFFREIKFLELPRFQFQFLNFANVKHKWKIQKLKNIFFWKIVEKLERLSGRQSWKVGTPFGTLTRQVEKLACFWHVGTPNWKIGTPLAHCHAGTFIGTLARKIEKLARFWQVGTRAHGHVDHGGTHGTHSTRFSKLFLGLLSDSETATGGGYRIKKVFYRIKKVALKISQYSLENRCGGVSF